MDRVRAGEHRVAKWEGDERLTGSKYLCLRRPAELSPEQRTGLRIVQREDFKVGGHGPSRNASGPSASNPHPGAVRSFLSRWYWRASQSRPKPMTTVARLIQRHLPNLLTYLRHRVTNAGLDGSQCAHRVGEEDARGFRNAEHFKTAIFFHCGGLDLYPHETR